MTRPEIEVEGMEVWKALKAHDVNDLPLFAEQHYGTEPHKLARRDGPDTSKAAAQSVKTTTAEAMVHRAIHGFGPNGCIVGDLFALAAKGELGKHAYSFTARLSGLQEKGFITAGPDTRPGPSGRQQRVMRSIREPAA